MKRLYRSAALLALSCMGLLSAPAWGRTFELRTLPLLTRSDRMAQCPDKVLAYETPRPYQEGSYTIDGSVGLTAIATNIVIGRSNAFRTIWVGNLKPPYRDCLATAGISAVDGIPYAGHSYMRLQYRDGMVFFILDMTGKPDANQYTATILHRLVQNSNPRWTWGGSD